MPNLSNRITLVFSGAFIPQCDGAHDRCAAQLDRLSQTFRHVSVYAYRDHAEYPWLDENIAAFHKRWPNVELVLEQRPAGLGGLERLKKVLIGLMPGASRQILKLRIAGATPRFDALKAQSRVFVVHYTFGLAELNGIDPERVFVETHDLQFLKSAKLAHRSPITVSGLFRFRAEFGVLAHVKGIFAIAPQEAALFRQMIDAVPVFYVSAWAPLLKKPEPDKSIVKDIDLLFVGSAYAMNARGLCAFLGTYGTQLNRFRIVVCGRVCEDEQVKAMALGLKNVTLMGFVEDLSPVYQRARAGLSPVDGTGLKIKITAALAEGLPVFASRHAIDGLADGHEGSVFEISETVFTSVLDDPERYAKACAAAIAYDRLRSEAGEVVGALAAIGLAQGMPMAVTAVQGPALADPVILAQVS